ARQRPRQFPAQPLADGRRLPAGPAVAALRGDLGAHPGSREDSAAPAVSAHLEPGARPSDRVPGRRGRRLCVHRERSRNRPRDLDALRRFRLDPPAAGLPAHGLLAGRLWALSPGSGATRWVGRVNGKIYGTPAVAGGRVFVPSVAYSLWAFSTRGRRLWSVSTGSYVYSTPAVADGVVCFGAYNGVFY